MPGINDLVNTDRLLISKNSDNKNYGITLVDLRNTISNVIGGMSKRFTWRSKNLGNVFTEAQREDIASGKFRDIFIGDYWLISNKQWTIVDIDYFRIPWDKDHHHVVVMPNSASINNVEWNTKTDNSTGYYGSTIRQRMIDEVLPIVEAFFGRENLAVHTPYLVNSVNANGIPAGKSEYHSCIELPTQAMLLGYNQYNYGLNSPGADTGAQFAACAIANGISIHPVNQNNWLQDVTGLTTAVFMANRGHVASSNISAKWTSGGIRPYVTVGTSSFEYPYD